jgi:hypothetical protein
MTLFKASEATLSVAEQVLAGVKVSSDDVIEQRWACDRQQACAVLRNAKRYLRKWHPDLAVGYLPRQNGSLGYLQRLNTLDDRIASTRRSFAVTRGHMAASGMETRNAPEGLIAADRAGWAEAVRPSFSQIMGQAAVLTVELLGAGDPEGKTKLLREFRRQLEAGDGSH